MSEALANAFRAALDAAVDDARSIAARAEGDARALWGKYKRDVRELGAKAVVLLASSDTKRRKKGAELRDATLAALEQIGFVIYVGATAHARRNAGRLAMRVVRGLFALATL